MLNILCIFVFQLKINKNMDSVVWKCLWCGSLNSSSRKKCGACNKDKKQLVKYLDISNICGILVM